MIRIKLLLLISTMQILLGFSLETDSAGLDVSDLTFGTDSHTGLSDRKAWTGRIVVRKGVKLFPEEAKGPNGSDVQTGHTDRFEGYQSDSAGSYKAAEEKLRRLNPTVHCGGDSMALRVQGTRVPNIMVDRGEFLQGKLVCLVAWCDHVRANVALFFVLVLGEEGVVPVTKLPANCGISTKRVRRDVLVVAQYQGCHVTKEGDDYVLPLRLWGASLNLCCPVESSTDGTPDPSAVLASVPEQNWPLSGPFPYYLGDQFNYDGYFWHSPANAPSIAAPTPAPTTEASTPASTTTLSVPASDPLQDWYALGPVPYLYGYPPENYWNAPNPRPSTAAPTTPPSTAAPTLAPTFPASDTPQNWYPFGPFPYNYRYPYMPFWQAPTPPPSTTAPIPPPTTAAPTPTSAPAPNVPASDPIQNWYPTGPFPYQWQHQLPPYGNIWQGPTTATSTQAPTTTTPTTTTSAVPTVLANDPQNNWYPIDPPPYQWPPFYPNGRFWYYPTAAPTTTAPTTAAPTTTSAPTVPASDLQQNWFNPNVFYPNGYPWMPHAGRPRLTSSHLNKQ
uniref:Uncharacterized protein n=1 Tax=Astyanax mexicanus TaxID=7994 RepID=A0A3B1KJM0_ASTMX